LFWGALRIAAGLLKPVVVILSKRNCWKLQFTRPSPGRKGFEVSGTVGPARIAARHVPNIEQSPSRTAYRHDREYLSRGKAPGRRMFISV